MARKSFGRRDRAGLADMSLPPAERGRRGRGKRRSKRVGGTPPAQMDHATGGKARKRQREGEARMMRGRRDGSG